MIVGTDNAQIECASNLRINKDKTLVKTNTDVSYFDKMYINDISRSKIILL